jgi:hypothetical protein
MGSLSARNVAENQAWQGIWATSRRRITWKGVGLPMEATPSGAVMGPFEIVKLCLAPLHGRGKKAHGVSNTLQRALGHSSSPIGSSVEHGGQLTRILP